MKTILSIAIAILVSTTVNSQVIYETNFENWGAEFPEGWGGTKTSLEADSTILVTPGAEYGINLCELVNTENSHKRFTTTGLPVEEGETYEIEFWVRGVGQIRTNIYDVSSGTNGYGTYNNYIDIDSEDSESHTQTVVADTTFSMAEFIISIRNTSALMLDSVVIRGGEPVIPTENTIYEIQFTEDSSGDSPLAGEQVITSGVVTGVTSQGYFIQDGAGAWNGVYVFDSNNLPEIGDLVNIAGSVTEYFNLTEITNVSSFEVVSSNNDFSIEVLDSSAVGSEMWEGVMVKVTGATCTAVPDEFGNWQVDNGGGAVDIDDVMFPYDPTLGLDYDVTGPLFYSFSVFRILPRDAADVIETVVSVEEFSSLDVAIYPTVFDQSITIVLEGTYQVSFITMDGKLVSTQNNLSNNAEISTTDLAAGIYLIQVTQGNKVSSQIVEKK